MSRVFINEDVLRRLEWICDEFTGVTGGKCHICGGYKRDMALRPGEFAGHAPNCELALALKKEGTDAN